MKKIILSILIFLFYINASLSHVGHYNDFNYLEYELFRNNKLIGSHKYDFNRNNENLTITSVVNFEIKKLNIILYKYFAESTEIYKNDKFFEFRSTTKQNKKDKYVNIKADYNKKKLNIDGTSFKGSTNLENIVGTWWNHQIIKTAAQISAISGRVIEQEVIFVGKEEVKIGDKTYKTLHFKFKSSDETLPDSKKLNTDIWYEEDSYLWVKAQFVKQGNWEYRIKEVK